MNATSGSSVPILVLAGPCPNRDEDQPHAWEPEDSADLMCYGEPDHGLSVSLGRCRACGHAMLAVDPRWTR